MAFIDDFIQRLRTATWEPGIYRRNAEVLADDLEHRRTKPRGDGYDIDITGDDEQDRKLLADWIERGAHAPAYCSPPCGRNFSEVAAWMLRNRAEGAPVLDGREMQEKVWEEKTRKRAAS